MTSRLALIALTVLGLAGSVVACDAPAVEGDTIANAPPSRNRDKGKETRSTKVDDSDPKEEAGQGSTTQKQTQTPPPEEEEEETTTPPPEEPPPPPPPPPPVTQPACGGGTPIACLDCCLDANPGAIAYENAHDDCLVNCRDSACDNRCQVQHTQLCAGNAACLANHACMEANGCLASNLCNAL
ncbi:MAG: hypothetical protein KIT84_17265 [Labilithrix sp.]|nr:hypothetical protein [Labilithrix sp.]MCW5812781.1 hypothetical protein [Labilithrix sp.]